MHIQQPYPVLRLHRLRPLKQSLLVLSSQGMRPHNCTAAACHDVRHISGCSWTQGCRAQVIEVCARVNPRLEIRRARFLALVHSDVTRAVHNLQAPREADALAVDARQEIDLRIGASFTRFQTLLLQVR